MQLQVNKTIKKRVITLEIDTINFSSVENTMLDELGEPVINFEKQYHSTSIQISKKLRSNFKFRVKFDGNIDTMDVVNADCLLFLDDLKDVVETEMGKLQDEFTGESANDNSVINIEY